MAAPQNAERIPPHNEEAERAVLGALLLDENAITVAIQYLEDDDFYSNANRRIYKAILDLFKDGIEAEIPIVVDTLAKAGSLDQAGGPAYVADLTNVVPTSANIEYYAKQVRDASIKRRLLRISGRIVEQAYDIGVESRSILEEAEKNIFDLAENRHTLTFHSARELIPQTIETIEKVYHSKEIYTGIPSGFDALDSLTSGFQKSELIIIGARPSVGKTALALTMAANMVMNKVRKIPVAFFTLEMSGMALMQRLVSSEARIDSKSFKSKNLKPSDFKSLMDAAGHIYDAPLYIFDMPNMPMLDIRAQAMRIRLQKQVEIIFIDYIGLISSENKTLQSWERVGEISHSLKSLARELEIPIVALSQVNRDAQDNAPTLANIRESGSIEQDADVVMFLHRKKDKKAEEEPVWDGLKTELIIAKQRNGPVGKVEIVFLPQYTKYENLLRNSYTP
ncbi:MAG: replicative DNA helicase [Spirochaetaceae bacterium]|jgi:replicative DNA helicase|nr:replicative DNA helicase [Spirochaetaceae bacterium]